MANGDDLVRDPEEERRYGGARVVPPRRFPPGYTGVPAGEAPPLPPGGTLPSTQGYQPDIPRAPMTLNEQIEQRRAVLKGKLGGPGPEATGWQRFRHGLSVVGQDIGMATRPDIVENIPGTIPNMRRELEELTKLQSEEQEREARGQREKEQTGIESRRLGLEERKFGTLERTGAERFSRDAQGNQRVQYGYAPPGDPTNVQWFDADQAGRQAPLPGAAAPGATIPGTQNVPMAPPPPTAPGTLPSTQETQAPMAAPQWIYGKPTAAENPLSAQEIAQRNAEARSFWERNNPGKPIPKAYELPPGATQKDADAMATMLNREQTQSGIEESRKFNEAVRKDQEARAKEAADLKAEEARGKWLRAVDNNGKVHFVTRGSYEDNQRNFKPNPGVLIPGSVEKATTDNKVLNEMQARMNATAESAQSFPWTDRQAKSLVIQAMARVQESYVDKTIGLPIMEWFGQNLKKLGLEGADSATRQYIVDLIMLREAMLGMPREITGGSRQMQSAIEALYATLPSGATPDLDYSMRQMIAAQNVMDRLRGSGALPIIEGMTQIEKLPYLYKHEFTSPKTGAKYYTDDKKEWFDENLKPVEGKPR